MNNTQLRSFLGFINYFRDHVPNHSNVVSLCTGMALKGAIRDCGRKREDLVGVELVL